MLSSLSYSRTPATEQQTQTAATLGTNMLEAQSQISFDDDNELFRQDTDAESDGEEQQELDLDSGDARDEPFDLISAELPSSGGSVKSKDHQEDKRGSGPATPKSPPKGKETVLVVRPAKPSTPTPVVTEKKKPLTLVELPVDVLKEIVKEVGLRHPLSAPPQIRVRQLLFYLPRLFLWGGLVWRGGKRGGLCG